MKMAFLPMAALVAVGCSANAAQSADEPAPSYTTGETMRDFALTGFDGVSLNGPDNADIRFGDSFSVRAEGDALLLSLIEVDIEDGVLRIGRVDNCTALEITGQRVPDRRRDCRYDWSQHDRAQIAVTMPVIRAAGVTGSGNMTVQGGNADEFKASIAGSGNLSVGPVTTGESKLSIAGSGDLSVETLTATSVEFSVAGSGNIRTSGTVRDIEISIAGSGDIAASDLRAETLDANVSGSGEVDAYVTGTAEASFVGSGEIRTRGGARCTFSGIGSGRLICS